MHRIIEALRTVVAAIRRQVRAVALQSERTLLLGTVLFGLAVSGAVGFVLVQYYSVDVLSSLLYIPQDCWADWGMQIGRHCFSDYPVIGSLAMRPNPWEPYWLPLAGDGYRPLRNEYPAAAMVPFLLLWSLGRWLGSPQLGLVIALTVLAIAVLTPAVWAARGARGLERVVIFVACGAAAAPAWMVIDRGNSVGLVAPIALVFLVALCRRRWGIVAIMVVLAALVKPQFAVLAVALFAARQWRLGAAAVSGAAITNLGAYLLWPRDFPGTIGQSIHNAAGEGSWRLISSPLAAFSAHNVSFANGLSYSVRKAFAAVGADGISDGFLNRAGSLVGFAILVVVVGSVVALGRRIDPVMAGIALLPTASLFPAVSFTYYLVFVLPVAALVARDPDGPPGSGIFDRFAALGDRRRVVGIAVSLSAALSIAQIAIPHSPRRLDTIVGATTIVPTTTLLVPLAWLITCAAIILSYALRPACLPSQ
ncbi:MAG: hypothetical protein QOC63_4422 [Mycobacterium sp.]|nr:hypothetical protein [Mycobacterium sp.]